LIYETPIAEKMDRSGVGKGYYFYIRTACFGSGTLNLDIRDGTTAALYTTGCIFPTDNNWHHVGVTVSRSSGRVTFYVDGVATILTSPALPTGNINNTVSLLIRATGSGFTPGPISIDELEMFNRALAALEIQAIVRAGPAGK